MKPHIKLLLLSVALGGGFIMAVGIILTYTGLLSNLYVTLAYYMMCLITGFCSVRIAKSILGIK